MTAPSRRGRGRRHHSVLTAALGMVLVSTLAACGDDEPDAAAAPPPDAAEQPTATGAEEAGECAEEWTPDGDVEWIVPYSPGGGFDTYSRGIAQVMEEAGFLPDGVNVVIRNVTPLPQGITQMYTSDPDGSVVGILPMPAAIAQQIQSPEVSRWETEEFTVLGSVDENAYVVYVPADSPYTTIEDLVAAEGLQSITVEEGSSSALATLATIAELELDANLTYGAEGSSEVVAAALRGDADFFVYGSTDVVGFIESGDVRPLLFIGNEDQRPEALAWLQDVPGAEEAGYGDLAGTVTELRAIVAPPALPCEVAEFWRTALYETMTSEEFETWAADAERPIVPRTFEEATETMQQQIERMQVLVPELTGSS